MVYMPQVQKLSCKIYNYKIRVYIVPMLYLIQAYINFNNRITIDSFAKSEIELYLYDNLPLSALDDYTLAEKEFNDAAHINLLISLYTIMNHQTNIEINMNGGIKYTISPIFSFILSQNISVNVQATKIVNLSTYDNLPLSALDDFTLTAKEKLIF